MTAHFLWWIHDPLLNKMVYWNFYNHFYRYVDAIHYPSVFIKALFEKETGKHPTGYVISNGIKAEIHPDPSAVRDPKYDGKFVIVCVGRLSKEKKQMLLVKAIGLSRHVANVKPWDFADYAKAYPDEPHPRLFSAYKVFKKEYASL